jgi:thiol-disulfide isomerase/thioredoxin
VIGSLAVALLLSSQPPTTGIRWERHFDAALKKARAGGKPVLVDFWADWCGWCHRLDKTTYADPVVAKLAEDFVAVKVNTEGSPREMEVVARYDVSSLPTILFLTPRGRPITRVNGFQGPGEFPRTLERAREQSRKLIEWEAALDRNSRDAAALAGLGVHLYEQETYEESRELLYRAARNDADQPAEDRRRTRLLLGIIQYYDRKFAEAESLLKEALSLGPRGGDQPKLLFVLGRTYVSWGRHAEARRTMQVIVKEYADSPMAQKARETLVALEGKR